MKFDPPIPSLAPADAEAGMTARFTLEHGGFAGRAYTATLRICPNPCCPCEAVDFTCQPDAEPRGPEASGLVSPAPLRFDLNVSKRAVNPQAKSSPEAVALAGAVVAEMQPPDWEGLAQLFLDTKRGQMETVDLDDLDVRFPPEVMAGDGSMVGYMEVFPWAESFEFMLDEAHWVADDQYCTDPACNCTKTALSFFRIPVAGVPPARRLKCEVLLWEDYAQRTTKVVQAKRGSPPAGKLMQALRAVQTDLDRTLQKRHRQMKRLGRRLLPKNRWRSKPALADPMDEGVDERLSVPPASPTKPAPKVGRNDPCPCGSGKKYKKCCGR